MTSFPFLSSLNLSKKHLGPISFLLICAMPIPDQHADQLFVACFVLLLCSTQPPSPYLLTI